MFQPTLLGAVWAYRVLVLFLTVLFAAAGYWYATRTEVWSASASFTVQNPQSVAVFDANANLDPRRHVANQTDVLKSYAVAQTASSLLAAEDPPITVSPDVVRESITVSSNNSSDVVFISFTHPDGVVAIAAANAVLDAYREVSRDAAEASYTEALGELEASIADRESELAAIATQLGDSAEVGADIIAVQNELDAAVAEMALFAEPLPEATPEVLALAATRLQELGERVALLRISLTEMGVPADTSQLLRQRADVGTRLSALLLRRDQLAVDADLAGSGVGFTTTAVTASPSGVTTLVAAGLLGGALIGVALAYSLALRRQRFNTRSEPQIVLGTNLVSDIPDFSMEGLKTDMPVRDAPATAAAEAFRFVATSLLIHNQDETSQGRAARLVAVVAASSGEGNSVVTANSALAAARAGHHVAVIDADFATQGSTRLLLDGNDPQPGLIDVAAGKIDIDSAAIPIETGQSGSLSLFCRGTTRARGADLFTQATARPLLDQIRSRYDLVLIDTPPLLRIAYSRNIARLSDAALVVVDHGGSTVATAELRDQLLTMHVEMSGYVYNRAPLRREMIRLRSELAMRELEMSAPSAEG